MKLKQFFHPGFRTLKTALSVFCCILLFQVLHIKNPSIACLSAVFALREDSSESYSFGKSRIISNSFGVLLALLIFQLKLLFNNQIINLIFVPIACIIFIQTMLWWNNKAGIINGLAAFFMIYFSIPVESSLNYAIMRTLDTFIGVFIAIIINHYIYPMRKQTPTTAEQISNLEKELAKLKAQQAEENKKNYTG